VKGYLATFLSVASLGCRGPLQASAGRDSAIVAAVKFARGLQQSYWDSLYIPHKRVPTRDVILAYYRRGYGDSLAAVYTQYALSHAPEPIMIAPDTVKVLHATASDASAAYATPETLREIWDTPAYTTDYLHHVGTTWKVVKSTQSSSRPVSY